MPEKLIKDSLSEVGKAAAKPTSKRKETRQTEAEGHEIPQDIQELTKSLEKMEAHVYIQPRPMWGNIFRDNEETKQTNDINLSVMYRSLLEGEKRVKVIDKILSEIVLGAYQDRTVAYSISPSGLSADSTEAMEMIQRIRHSADRHLIRVLQAFKDIKRPAVKVVVKQAEQVNVAEKQMNVDKQLNISSDLDR